MGVYVLGGRPKKFGWRPLALPLIQVQEKTYLHLARIFSQARKRPKPEPEPLPEKPRQKKVKQQGITVDELQDILGEDHGFAL